MFDLKEIQQQIDELNLDGYKKIKNTDWGLPETLINFLEQHDFEELGRGYFSRVYQSKTENFVVKVNVGREIDQGYLDFLSFCKTVKNPHLPKVGKVRELKNGNKEFYVVFIEKLQPFDGQKYSLTGTRLWNIFNNSIKFFISTENKDERINHCKELFSKYKLGIEKIEPIFNQLYDCIEIMAEFSEKSGISKFDLHAGNLMMRGNTLVITDPVSFGDEEID